MTNVEPRPFVKWVGGKARSVSMLLERIPASWNPETDLYIEPFVGGGVLFFALQLHNALLNDANEALMGTYRAVRDDKETLHLLGRKARFVAGIDEPDFGGGENREDVEDPEDFNK